MGEKNRITGIEYLNLKHDSLRRKILEYEYLLLTGFAVLELIFYCLNIRFRFYAVPLAYYFGKILAAFLIALISIRVFSFFNFREDTINNTKNNLCCYSAMMMIIAFALVHCNDTIMWVLPALVVLFGAVFGNKKILISLFWTGILGQGLFFVLACLENNGMTVYYVVCLILGVIAMVGTFLVGKNCVDYIGRQLEDIVNYYDGEKELKQQLETEYLTGLLSRSAINNELMKAVHDAYFFHKQLICVAMIDLDYFKSVNDTYGHDKGDEVLKRLAYVIKEYLDDNICAGRVGGEEFLIVFRNQSRMECKEILNGMLRNFRSQKFDFLPEKENLTFSGGMCWMSNDDMDEQKLRLYADKALYYSKEHGRNKITEFELSMLEPR